VTGPLWINRGVIAGYHAALLEPPDPLGDRRRGQVHAPAEVLAGEAAVGLELGEDAPVQVIEGSFHTKGRHPDFLSSCWRGPSNSVTCTFALSTIVWSGTIGAVVGPALFAPAAHAAVVQGLPELSGPIAVSALGALYAVLAAGLLPRGAGQLARPGHETAPGSAMKVEGGPRMVPRAGRGTSPCPWHHQPATTAPSRHPGPRPPCQLATRGRSPKAIAATLPETFNTVHCGHGGAVGPPLALSLLGYRWNLAFVGGSSLRSQDLPERTRIQLRGASTRSSGCVGDRQPGRRPAVRAEWLPGAGP
jgi:hypothetical protein